MKPTFFAMMAAGLILSCAPARAELPPLDNPVYDAQFATGLAVQVPYHIVTGTLKHLFSSKGENARYQR
jgi:hypothetical protein